MPVPIFSDWAINAVFSGLSGEPTPVLAMIGPDGNEAEVPTFRDWSAGVVFSSLPAKRRKREPGPIIARAKEPGPRPGSGGTATAMATATKNKIKGGESSAVPSSSSPVPKGIKKMDFDHPQPPQCREDNDKVDMEVIRKNITHNIKQRLQAAAADAEENNALKQLKHNTAASPLLMHATVAVVDGGDGDGADSVKKEIANIPNTTNSIMESPRTRSYVQQAFFDTHTNNNNNTDTDLAVVVPNSSSSSQSKRGGQMKIITTTATAEETTTTTTTTVPAKNTDLVVAPSSSSQSQRGGQIRKAAKTTITTTTAPVAVHNHNPLVIGIIKKDQSPPFGDWATDAVFSGLVVEKAEQQSSFCFDDWAGGAVFKNLPGGKLMMTNVDVNGEPKQKISRPTVLAERIEKEPSECSERANNNVISASSRTTPLALATFLAKKIKKEPSEFNDRANNNVTSESLSTTTTPLALAPAVIENSKEEKIMHNGSSSTNNNNSSSPELPITGDKMNTRSDGGADISSQASSSQSKSTFRYKPSAPKRGIQNESSSSLSKGEEKDVFEELAADEGADITSQVSSSQSKTTFHYKPSAPGRGIRNESNSSLSKGEEKDLFEELDDADNTRNDEDQSKPTTFRYKPSRAKACLPEEVSAKDKHEVPFDKWAIDVVFSGLVPHPKPEPEVECQPSTPNFKDWSTLTDIVYDGRMKARRISSVSDKSEGSLALDFSGANDSFVVSEANNSKRKSIETEKSVDFNELLRRSSSRCVAFRDHDSYIMSRSFLNKSSLTNSDINEGSADLGTLLEEGKADEKTDDDAVPSLSDKMMEMDMVGRFSGDFDMIGMGRSLGDLDFNYDEGKEKSAGDADMPRRRSSEPVILGGQVRDIIEMEELVADIGVVGKPAVNLDMMAASYAEPTFHSEESNAYFPPQCLGSQPLDDIMEDQEMQPQLSDSINQGILQPLEDITEDQVMDPACVESIRPKTSGLTGNVRGNVPPQAKADESNIQLPKVNVERKQEFTLLHNKGTEEERKSSVKDLIRKHRERRLSDITETNSGSFNSGSDTTIDRALLHMKNKQNPSKEEVKKSLQHMRIKQNPSNEEAKSSKKSANGQENDIATSTTQYAIPKIFLATAIKEKPEDKVGLVLSDKRYKIFVANITPASPFAKSELALNDELLVINGHRIKNAKKGAEFIKATQGNLTLTCFKGKRPRESELEMMRISRSELNDISFFTNNQLVHVMSIGGRFAKSGKIRTGDICLSINGIPVDDAERAIELLRDYSQDNHAPQEEKKDSSNGLVIMLMFSKTKLRYRLIKKLASHLPLTWNKDFSECAVKLPSGEMQPMLQIHNDGNTEGVLEALEQVDKKTFSDIETFASNFYLCFQESMSQLREAMSHSVGDCHIII